MFILFFPVFPCFRRFVICLRVSCIILFLNRIRVRAVCAGISLSGAACSVRIIRPAVPARRYIHRNPAHPVHIDLYPCMGIPVLNRSLIDTSLLLKVIHARSISGNKPRRYAHLPQKQRSSACKMHAVPFPALHQEIPHRVFSRRKCVQVHAVGLVRAQISTDKGRHCQTVKILFPAVNGCLVKILPLCTRSAIHHKIQVFLKRRHIFRHIQISIQSKPLIPCKHLIRLPVRPGQCPVHVKPIPSAVRK